MSLVLLIVGATQSVAQIVLHEATDITQTKATLSADFPENSTEHGFQYKYGTVPEIDEFSQIALSSSSDPINLVANNWHPVESKGYVETYSGQNGTITAKVVLYQPSTVSFDWSIDAQEGCAYLRYSKDTGLGSSSFGGSTSISYYEISRITGNTPFTTYTTSELPAGTHYLKWEYCQVSPSSVGLDVARIKNITIQNTQPGDWNILNTSGSSLELTSLVPNSNVIYRGYSSSSEGTSMSFIKSFHTSSLEIEPVQIGEITQTTAKINRKVGFSETHLSIGINYKLTNPQVVALVNEDTDCTGITISANKWEVTNQGLQYTVTHESGFSYGVLSLNFETFGEKYASYKIEFDVNNVSTDSFGCYCGLFVDGEKNVKETFGKGKSHYVLELRPGAHTLQWKTNRWNSSAAGGTVTISNLSIENIVSGTNFQTSYTTDDFTLLTDLSPNSTYSVQSFVIPSGALESPQAWQGERSDWFRIHTRAIEATVECKEITQTTFTVIGNINRGDASSKGIGFQYKLAYSDSWIDVPLNNEMAEFTQNVNRLKPANTYEVRAYAIYENGEYVFSNSVSVTTLSVVPQKPNIIFLSQHQANIQGEIIFGNASIYQRGMQFREEGVDAWTDVEDNGDGTVFTLIRKDLESGRTYEARTYVQPAGCEVIYSDILEFTTLDNYFISCNSNERTQTSITLYATLADVDEDVEVERYGFEYYIDSDGFFENADSFVKSEIYDIPVAPNGKELKTTIIGLCPSLGICWRAYAQINGIKTYFTSYKNWKWNGASTDRATIAATIKNITQTSISLELDATQEGDAIVSQIEYALANSVQETQPYSICGNTVTLNNLVPNKQYNIRFRGLVNNRYCPLLKEISWDYSWFEFKTLPIDVNVQFSNITQTRANMKVVISSGDASISNLRYSINYGDKVECQENNLLTNLIPGQSYSVTIYANVNGEELSWDTNISDESFKFTTKSVTSSVSINSVLQTSANIRWSSNCGDATFISSGLEIAGTTYNSESQDTEMVITELLPGQSYSCRSFVETKEGGCVYSSPRTFTTENIVCETLPVSNISNRSATMNGTIECDSYSSAEFGFQWKQMEGWVSEPAFTKGRKLDDGTISVALVNGMLEPNTDYQYRAAVRYQDHIYYAPNWVTFRTESEFVYYPASVYTLFRTNRENNALILCGYYVAGSEKIISQGYEYWQTGGGSYQSARASQSPSIINTDESMQYELAPGELPYGNYNVRAFVKTESGATIYGATVGFSSSSDGYSGVEMIESELPYILAEGGVVKVYNANDLNCIIYSVNGQILANTIIDGSYYEFRLTPDNFIIVTLSNGLTKKIKI